MKKCVIYFSGVLFYFLLLVFPEIFLYLFFFFAPAGTCVDLSAALAAGLFVRSWFEQFCGAATLPHFSYCFVLLFAWLAVADWPATHGGVCGGGQTTR